MTDFPVSSRLLATLPRLARTDAQCVQQFESGSRTRSVTRAYERQVAGLAITAAVNKARRVRPSKEDRDKEIERRRKWSGDTGIPPAIRGKYTEAERAALAVMINQCRKKGFCDLCYDEIARLAGVSRTSVQNAFRKARDIHKHISVRERPQPGGKSLTNIIKVVCSSWIGWLSRRIGFKQMSPSETGDKKPLSIGAEMERKALERECVANAKQFLMNLPSRLNQEISARNPFQHWKPDAPNAHSSGGWR